ncbi:rhomboid family intramembrane serine protease [Geopsychrobacter electrodiphilus]|uniref:rhomboid family intramembrane serine protease n=1 Tax=Geopsychrobacter electrodiphilus TaxID=225196 RepID=UPI00036122EE|nr:rhomboid family intramembrane serine protease [Geopsychrobacter electrodiphilus]
MDNTPELQPAEPEWLAIPPDLLPEGVARPLSRKLLRRWGLVLEARGIPFHNEALVEGWYLRVPPALLSRACNELRRYEELNHNWPPPLPAATPQQDNLLSTLCVLLAVATFYNLTQIDINLLGHHPVNWNDLGNADARKILQGEWWRLITALTLHADWLHLLGNLVIGGFFISRLCRDLGAGLGWSLLLASGLLGNALNAWLQHPEHQSIGASTAVFGAIGILAAISLVRYRRSLRKRWPLPLAAALALLAMLGSSGEHTDLGAHLFGFGCGIVLGLVTEYLQSCFGRPGSGLNRLLALGSAALVFLAWWAALSA